MAHVGEKGALRPVGRLGGVLRGDERLFSAFPFCDVLAVDVNTIGVGDRRDRELKNTVLDVDFELPGNSRDEHFLKSGPPGLGNAQLVPCVEALQEAMRRLVRKFDDAAGLDPHDRVRVLERELRHRAYLRFGVVLGGDILAKDV